jgi:KUP system potassium uptake protein
MAKRRFHRYIYASMSDAPKAQGQPLASRVSAEHRRVVALAAAAVGVVYGDIGTSPLYTMREVFSGLHPLPVNAANVLGILSLIFWSLIIVVTLKYVVFMMRADNRGEGGIMALTALVVKALGDEPRRRRTLVGLGLFGAALFYGDAMITPAISVLSAVEGLAVATPYLEPVVEPAAVAVLLALFLLQRRGTGTVGALFGPVMMVWFATLALLGLAKIVQVPQVLNALNPWHAVTFFAENRWQAYLALGAVVLAITGAEALYADMGHFGRRPIRLAWTGLVLPALVINYFGQGALLLTQAEAARNPFYLLAPSWALYPLVALATAATVIASQAVISGAFSLTHQAIQLGYCPRLEIIHTSEREMGQIYLPWVNWALLAAVVALVLGFHSSSHLAAAYGIAVTATMAIDSLLLYVVLRHLWRWSRWAAGAVAGLLLTVDFGFFSANALKLFQGGWFPVIVGVVLFTLFSTWYRGRQLVFERLRSRDLPLEPTLESLKRNPPLRVPGTAVFLTSKPDAVPHALLHNLAHNKVLHERVVFLTVTTEPVPRIPEERRVELQALGAEFYRVMVRYGFMDQPDIPAALDRLRPYGLEFPPLETTYFLSRETLIPSLALEGMALWRERLFATLARNASSVTAYFRLPTHRVVELGTQIEL